MSSGVAGRRKCDANFIVLLSTEKTKLTPGLRSGVNNYKAASTCGVGDDGGTTGAWLVDSNLGWKGPRVMSLWCPTVGLMQDPHRSAQWTSS